MKDAILRFLAINPLNDHPMIYWGMIVVWLVLVANCFFSIRSLRISLAARWMWFLLVLCVPVIGMFIYLGSCLLTADYSFLKFLLGPPSRAKQALAGKPVNMR